MIESATTATATSAARLLCQAAAWLILGGLLTGGFVAWAMTGAIAADPHAMLASHLNALLGALWMVAVAWTLPMLRYGETGQKRLAWALVFANYANWLITFAKAYLHVAGVGKTGEAHNDAVFIALNIFVVTPAIVAAGAWALGFRR